MDLNNLRGDVISEIESAYRDRSINATAEQVEALLSLVRGELRLHGTSAGFSLSEIRSFVNDVISIKLTKKVTQ
jgi:hypothetical protein